MNNSFFITLCFYISAHFSLSAQQNLVYNGDFELYDTCPTSGSTPTDHQLEHCLGWTMPTYATSDYFNTCAGSSGAVGIPQNFCGFQLPQSGSAYCGLWCVKSGGWWIEYIQGQLTTSLLPGTVYNFSMHVSNSYCFYYGVSGLGAYFSPSPITRPDPNPFNTFVPQVSSPTNVILSDSSDWTKIEGSFTASGGEQYVTIGWFVDTSNANFFVLDSSAIDIGAYYYIDNVDLNVSPSSIVVPNVFSPNNDGINDAFSPQISNIKNMQCKIYNRWGQLICLLDQTNTEWNGKYRDEECSAGVYYYTLEATGNDDINYTKSGFVHLVR